MKKIHEEKLMSIIRCIDTFLAMNVGGRQKALGLTAEEAEMI